MHGSRTSTGHTEIEGERRTWNRCEYLIHRYDPMYAYILSFCNMDFNMFENSTQDVGVTRRPARAASARCLHLFAKMGAAINFIQNINIATPFSTALDVPLLILSFPPEERVSLLHSSRLALSIKLFTNIDHTSHWSYLLSDCLNYVGFPRHQGECFA